MTGQVLDRDSVGILILIIPMAFAVIIVSQLWPILLGLVLLISIFKAWQNYQWQQWSKQVNPYFNNLITENRGYLTPLDLSLKADLSARSAKAFLERKCLEYGTTPQEIPDKGVVYYFPTASALGSIFDDSEPNDETEISDSTPSKGSSVSFKEITQIAKEEQGKTTTITKTIEKPKLKSLNQADLAKRLDVNSSTVGRNKNKSESDFAMWSQSKDPDGIAWKYISKTNQFLPIQE